MSDTDLKLFVGLSNPEKTNRDPDEDHEDDDDDNDDEGGGEEQEDEADGYEDEEDEGEDELDDAVPDLSRLPGSNASAMSSATSAASRDMMPPPAMSKEEIDYAKTSVLLELERLRGMGCNLTREYSMDDPLEEMEYEARRHVLMLEETNSVNMMKDGLRLFVSGCEFANGKFGPFLNLDGFSQAVSSELTAGKYNMTLTKLHRKYFKTPVQNSPEVELAMGLMGAAAMHHFQRSYMHKIMPTRMPPTNIPNVPPAADDDSDEDLPPNFGT